MSLDLSKKVERFRINIILSNIISFSKYLLQPKVNPLRTAKTPTGLSQPVNDESLFKVPTKLVSGLRAPTGGASKRVSLVRPSSGYYSLNVGAKGMTSTSDAESDNGRHSPEVS